MAMRLCLSLALSLSLSRAVPSHGLELIDALLSVALSNLAQGLVLVPSSLHILSMQHVILGLLAVIPSLGQL